jgi:hypothetical protein
MRKIKNFCAIILLSPLVQRLIIGPGLGRTGDYNKKAPFAGSQVGAYRQIWGEYGTYVPDKGVVARVGFEPTTKGL